MKLPFSHGAGMEQGFRDADSGAMIGKPMRHDDEVNGALFSDDETKNRTWGDDKTARLWNADNNTMIDEPMLARRRSKRCSVQQRRNERFSLGAMTKQQDFGTLTTTP